MKKLLLLPLFTLAACSCTSEQVKQPACAIQDQIVGSLTKTAVDALQCSNYDVIKADITASLGKANLCTQTAQGPIAIILCPIAVKAVTDLFQSKIPDTWGCKISDGSKLSESLKATCIATIPLGQ
jgi:hypothetical protein